MSRPQAVPQKPKVPPPPPPPPPAPVEMPPPAPVHADADRPPQPRGAWRGGGGRQTTGKQTRRRTSAASSVADMPLHVGDGSTASAGASVDGNNNGGTTRTVDVFFVRHGVSYANDYPSAAHEAVLQGLYDAMLTRQGVVATAENGRRFRARAFGDAGARFDLTVASLLTRTWESAHYFGGAAQRDAVLVAPFLRETIRAAPNEPLRHALQLARLRARGYGDTLVRRLDFSHLHDDAARRPPSLRRFLGWLGAVLQKRGALLTERDDAARRPLRVLVVTHGFYIRTKLLGLRGLGGNGNGNDEGDDLGAAVVGPLPASAASTSAAAFTPANDDACHLRVTYSTRDDGRIALPYLHARRARPLPYDRVPVHGTCAAYERGRGNVEPLRFTDDSSPTAFRYGPHGHCLAVRERGGAEFDAAMQRFRELAQRIEQLDAQASSSQPSTERRHRRRQQQPQRRTQAQQKRRRPTQKQTQAHGRGRRERPPRRQQNQTRRRATATTRRRPRSYSYSYYTTSYSADDDEQFNDDKGVEVDGSTARAALARRRH